MNNFTGKKICLFFILFFIGSQFIFYLSFPKVDDQNIPLKKPFLKGEGVSWIVNLSHLQWCSDLNSMPARSPINLLENNFLLGPSHSIHAQIREKGLGAFSHWGENLLFSASDNSDPNSNGRTYFLSVQKELLPYPIWANFVFLVISLSGLIAVFFSKLLKFERFQSNFLIFLCFNIVQYYVISFLLKASPTILLGKLFIFACTLSFILFSVFYFFFGKCESQFFFENLSKFLEIISKNVLVVAGVFLLFIFFITRVSLFFNYPSIGFCPDSNGYISLAEEIGSGRWPQFIIRTPGYPIFLWVVTKIHNSWFFVLSCQHLLSLASVLFMVYSFYKLSPFLALPIGLAMTGYLGSSQVLIYDTLVLSENLFANSIILAFAFFVLGISTRQKRYLLLSSFFMAWVIWVRPAGLYFLVIYLFVAFFLFRNSFTIKAQLSFGLPFPIFLFLLCLYNFFSIGSFTLTPWGEGGNLALATITYWEPSEKFPPKVNQAIKEVPEALNKRLNFSSEDKKTIETSWDFQILTQLFLKAFNGLMYDYSMGEHFGDIEKPNYMENRNIVREVCKHAISSHPLLYGKFVYANFRAFFANIGIHSNFYSFLLESGKAQYGNPKASWVIYENYLKEFASKIPPSYLVSAPLSKFEFIGLRESFPKAFHEFFQSFHNAFFYSGNWQFIYFISLISSCLMVIRSRFCEPSEFIFFILTISVLGSSLIVCLVEIGIERYSYPTQFIYYVSAVLLPFCWWSHSKKKTS